MNRITRIAQWAHDRFDAHLDQLPKLAGATTEEMEDAFNALPMRVKLAGCMRWLRSTPYGLIVLACGFLRPAIWRELE